MKNKTYGCEVSPLKTYTMKENPSIDAKITSHGEKKNMQQKHEH